MSKRNYLSIDDLSLYAPDLDVSDEDATLNLISRAEDAIDFYVGYQQKFIPDNEPAFGVSTGEGNVITPEVGTRFMSFLDLSDVPEDYDGQSGLFVRVKSTEDGLEFATVSAGAGTWGSITGTLSAQTDLQSALDAKYNASNPSGFVSNLSTFTTTNLAEGSNLYFTNERVDDRVNALLLEGAGIDLTYDDNLGTLTVASTITQYTNEMVDDRVASLIVQGAGITSTYDDNANTLTIASTITQYTDEMVDDRVSALLTAGAGIGLSYDDNANTLSITAISTFLGLTDTPDSYTGQTLKGIRVKGDESGLEFFDLPELENAVDSVFGRTGVVEAVSGDYTWDQIEKTVSDIADITDRSHTDLTDIGTNTHDDIDDHIADATIHFTDTFVHDTGDESVAGVKTFTSIPVLPNSDPTDANQAVRKSYVDAFALGITGFKTVRASTTAALPSLTYDNGTAGVGATLTEVGNGALPAQDGITLTVGQFLLVKDQAAGLQNGLYSVTQVGTGGTPFILTRITDADTAAELKQGTAVTVLEGSVNANSLWVQATDSPTIGTDSLVFSELPAPDPITASTGVIRVGNDIQIDLSDTNPSLEVTDGGLRAKVDDSTIERSSSGLRVKDLGITSAKLAGSIPDSKLSTISTTNKVDWAALNKTGSKLEDIADAVDLASASDGQVPVWDASNSKWIPASAPTPEAQTDFLPTQLTIHAAGATAFVVTNLAAALTALSANTRKVANLEGATHFRLCVTQTVAGAVGSKLRVRYSTNNSTFNDLDSDNSGDLLVDTGTGVKKGSYTPIVAGAKQDVWIQLYSIGGDGAIDPAFTEIYIEFKYNSSIVDGSQSSELFEELTFVASPNTVLTWASMPAAVTELFGNAFGREKRNLAAYSQYRIIVNQSVAGFAGADLNLQYSTNNSAYQAADTAAGGELDIGTGTGPKEGAWTNLVSGAKGDVWLRLVGKEGNGTLSPGFRKIKVQFRGQVFSPSAGSDTQVLFNDGGVPAGDAGMTYDKTLNKLILEALKITGGTPGVGKVLTSDADGDATWGDVPSTVDELNDLDDVDLTTPPTNGQALVFSDESSYEASHSPLAWNGNDYKSGNFGIGSANVLIYLFSGAPQGVTADDTPIDTESSTSNLHMALVDIPGGGGKSSILISDAVASSSAAFESLLQAEVDPSATVDNFKADFFVYVGGSSYTGGSLTGFEQAGTVSVVSGATTPPTLVLVPGEEQWKASTLPVAKVVAAGISDEGTLQTVSTATPTILNMPDTLIALSGWHTDSSPGKLNIESPGDVAEGAVATITVMEDGGNAIPTAFIEFQKSLPGDVWVTLGSGTGGTCSVPFDFDASGNQEAWRVRLTHTDGGDLDIYWRLQINFTPQ